MRALWLCASAVLLCAATARAGVKWEQDYGKALQRSLEEDKLLIIVFYAEW